MSGLRQIPRAQFDKGNDTARKTAIAQAEFISVNYNVLNELDQKSRPQGWKSKKFKELVTKLESGEHLEMLEYNYMQEFYDSVTSAIFKIPNVKNEFYKGHIK